MIPDPQVQELIKANIQRSKVIQDQVLSLILANIIDFSQHHYFDQNHPRWNFFMAFVLYLFLFR